MNTGSTWTLGWLSNRYWPNAIKARHWSHQRFTGRLWLQVTYTLEGSVAVVRLNRPAVLNALNLSTVAELRDAVARAKGMGYPKLDSGSSMSPIPTRHMLSS